MAGVIGDQLSPLDKEGFLCPICVQDLGSATALAQHFDTAHNENIPDVIDQVKGLFGKAKKLFNIDQTSEEKALQLEPSPNSRHRAGSHRSSQSYYVEHQECGQTRQHTNYFCSIRDAKVDHSLIEGNKIVIRMSKLVSDDVPEDSKKRKAFEQKTVPWEDDKRVRVCSTCGKSFNLRRRRHHCRLCGGIICDECSEFLPFTQAKIFISSMSSLDVSAMPNQPTFIRRGSNSSLNSLGSQDIGPALRICSKCRKLLELFKHKQDMKNVILPIELLYENLQENKSKVERITPDYTKMAFSICAGETTHSLVRAAELRQKIALGFQAMDTISKKIVSLKPEEEKPSERDQKLRLSIRAFAVSYVQECSAILPKLPNEKEYQQLIAQRDEERKRRVERELKEAQARENNNSPIRRPNRLQVSSDTKKLQTPSNNTVTGVNGWKPGEVDTKMVMDNDPMVQQINIIKGYLRQAKQAQKWDEVEMLEENLKHLEDEYYKSADRES